MVVVFITLSPEIKVNNFINKRINQDLPITGWNIRLSARHSTATLA
ncbi:hypothetical protein YPPY94_3912 [Yersinia pestis PY-94]|uniref:Uncharacterized protein n=2 Tax=Yersinia pseudotuberculosis complex TaxID=1649845 RepID=A0A0U1QZB0_YERP3|nr:hypothetical protein YpsIP31758_3342 [Yersinia pseudotuberculosis IP 31758]ABX87059.1 hypothetical protein YpAngola_A1010 [Yersinia pestis Angola]EDR33864.1 hypothetical protein YPIP275_4122 [Yersinia pestis biovar Orientalis str. IP275]EDR43356.1 hypothetical protein YpE1979001_2204 [Yersinia pestis biovar Antiqua str. E1979001]EDR49217.1 hypothetical protein YpB42003004_2735 [Yersinia pestis biovar Antiqua str. B42003004]EIQ85432.1 hypothetical protein YPPY02_3872 [Yersinia pestis PY-02]